MGRSKWLLLLLIPMLFGFDTRNPFRTRGPFKAYDFTIGSVGGGGGCTDGVDCLCDTLVTTSTLLFCEDWEDVDYYDDTANSWIAGAAGDGGNWDRGNQSQWNLWYGNGDHGFFKYSDGVPTIGSRCQFGSGAPGVGASYQGCTGQREYCSAEQGAITAAGAADCWGPIPSDGASLDVQRAGDFDAEVSTLTLVGGQGDAADIGGGNQSMAFRVPPGNNVGKTGTVYLKAVTGRGTASDNTNVTEVGITMALAYSPNILTETDSVIGYNGGTSQWKHDEWAEDGQSNQEHWNLGNTGCGDVSEFPYRGFLWTSSQSACTTALGTASKTVGNASCNSAALQLCSTSAYSITQSDSPIGRWVCHQAHIRGLGTSDVDIEIKHNGTTVIKLENFDGASALDNQYYSNFIWDSYVNRNEDASDGTANDTDVTQYRYQDEIVVVNGPPEPCSSIGF